ncbi:MAG: TetR/AcrR family transcriptional regulator [Solirubrobacteraceae bacterium]
MIDLTARDGYHGVSVAQLSAHATVSSATFYTLFTDKEACALAAYRTATERILRRMEPLDPATIATTGQWSAAAVAALRRLLEAVRDEPCAARLIFVESLAGGPRVREERRAVTSVFQRRAQALLASTPDGAQRLDVPPAALLGALRSIVARHLRTSAEDQLPELAEDLVAWVSSYAVAPTRTPWSTGPRARLRGGDETSTPKPATTRRLPRGRHRLPPSVIARSHRTRLIHAIAQVTYQKGYAETTVADVVTAAGVSRHVFYEHFSDKEHAFLEAQQYPAQHIFDECAAAYFGAPDWPTRVWSGLKALLELVVVNPAVSHLRLVECYAAGPAAARRAEDVTRSFTIFFEEGFATQPPGRQLPRLAAQAITGALFEIIQRHAVRAELKRLPLLLPQLTYIATAPFIGAEQAIDAIGLLVSRQRDAGKPDDIQNPG